MTEDELIELLRERQNNGRTAYLTFGDLVAMVPLDQSIWASRDIVPICFGTSFSVESRCSVDLADLR